MNTFLSVLIVGFVAATAVATKPDCTNVAHGTQFADPNNCQQYFICARGKLIEADCGAGLVYDMNKHYCDREGVAQCASKPIIPTYSICAGKIDGATLPIAGKCSQFQICIDQMPNEAHCSNGLEYSETQGSCVAPHLSGCSRPIIPPVNPSPPHSGLADCTGKPDSTSLPMYGECSKFLICIDQISYAATCPNGLEYSEAHQSCVLPYMSGCSRPVIPPGKINPPVNPPQYGSPDCTAQLDGTSLPSYGDCSRYFICIHQVAYSAGCDNGLEFSEKHRTCVPAGSSGCISSGIVNPPFYPPVYPPNHNADLPAGCANKPEGTLIPYPGDCTKYITCYDEGVVKSCPSPLHFNAKQQVCDWPQTAGCI